MGILDDAIRQHLELKRQHGADEGELKDLEGEAFGPAARPGEPDFPVSEENAEAPAPEDLSAEVAGVAAPIDSPETVEPDAVAEPPVEPPVLETPPDPAPGPPVAEPERGELEPEAAEGFSTQEREAIAEQPTEFFDQAQVEGVGLELDDLDLNLDEDLESGEQTGEEPLTGEEPELEPAEPISDEQPLEPESTEQPVRPDSDEQPLAATLADPLAEGEGEDVLEETPEFLQDSPEDDELWFEQGEPKDFDF